jgi:hypothetical protein
MNCCNDFGQCTQGKDCPVRQQDNSKAVWPFPAAPLPNDRTIPPFNPNNFEDAPL